MELDEVKKIIQDFFQENTVTIVGSGLSLAEGIPGMSALATELLDVGEALVVGDAILLPSKILLDKPTDDHQPVSATKNFWDEWDSKMPNNDAVSKAVESLRSQSRL